MNKLLIVLPVAALAYVAAVWTTGRIAERQIDTEMARVASLLPALKITEDQHQRGVFGSTRQTTVDVGALFDSARCPAPGDAAAEAELPEIGVEASEEPAQSPAARPPPGMGTPPAEPLLVTLKQTIRHGPLPGFGPPAAAAVHTEWLVNGQPLADRPGLALEGALPVLSLRYGFTGDSTLSIEGAAATLRVTGKQGVVTLAWPVLSAQGRFEADSSAVRYELDMPELQVEFAGVEAPPFRLKLGQVSLAADHRYPIPGQFFVYSGSDRVTLASLSASQGGKSLFEALDFAASAESQIDAGLVASTAKVSLGALTTGAQQLGPFQYDSTLARLDAAAYGALMTKIITNDLGSCPTTEQTMAFASSLGEQLPALLKAGPEFHIARLSVGYLGSEAVLTGRVVLPPAPAEAFENPAALIGQISANATLSVADALLQNLVVKSMGEKMAGQMAAESLAASGQPSAAPSEPPEPTPEQRQRAVGIAQTRVAEQLEQALAKNWIVRGKAGIESRVEFSAGQLLLNGQPLDLRGLREGRESPAR